jgi:hypothetical protein
MKGSGDGRFHRNYVRRGKVKFVMVTYGEGGYRDKRLEESTGDGKSTEEMNGKQLAAMTNFILVLLMLL